MLDFAHTVLSGYRSEDAAIARMLETSTLYIVPRLCPDGSEQYLTTPYTCRSTPILWPGAPSLLPSLPPFLPSSLPPLSPLCPSLTQPDL